MSSRRHVTGDYYWDEGAHSDLRWAVAGILTLVVPPVGMFLVGYMVVDSLETGVE